MGIRGIEHLTGGTMENEQQDQPQKDTTAAAPVDAGLPQEHTSPEPPTPAHEEANRAAGQEPEGDDTAPDADEPGDDVAPEELAQYEQEQPDNPDEADQPSDE